MKIQPHAENSVTIELEGGDRVTFRENGGIINAAISMRLEPNRSYRVDTKDLERGLLEIYIDKKNTMR
jgi:hypothetical protein